MDTEKVNMLVTQCLQTYPKSKTAPLFGVTSLFIYFLWQTKLCQKCFQLSLTFTEPRALMYYAYGKRQIVILSLSYFYYWHAVVKFKPFPTDHKVFLHKKWFRYLIWALIYLSITASKRICKSLNQGHQEIIESSAGALRVSYISKSRELQHLCWTEPASKALKMMY